MLSQPGQPPVPVSLSTAPPLLVLGLVVSFLLGVWDGKSELPQSIVFQDWVPDGGAGAGLPPGPPSLRGCCGSPAEFRWVFLDSAEGATAGTPFRTRVLALDAQGRQARPSDCGELRVGLGLSGRARLSRDTSPTAWRNSELDLNIENERAEVVEAEVRIERGKEVLQHTSRISFASGPARGFSLRLRRASSTTTATGDGDQPTGWWPLGVQLDVIVSTQDRFGNAVPLDRSLSETLALRCNYFELVEDQLRNPEADVAIAAPAGVHCLVEGR